MSDLQAVVHRFAPGWVVLRALTLTGGVSARVTALDIRNAAGAVRRVVVREYGARDLHANPHVAAQEFALLGVLHAQGMPVPEPLWHGPGVLVQRFVAGHSGAEVGADPVQLAQFLARLHALEPHAVALPRLQDVPPTNDPPDDSLSESCIRAALAEHSPVQVGTAVLHGDYWPGNTLWQGGHLSAVLDWEDAALGDPLSDVGNARLELLIFAGPDATDEFTRSYRIQTGADRAELPSWDLRAALRPCGKLHTWGLDAGAERTMRERHAQFVHDALTALQPR